MCHRTSRTNIAIVIPDQPPYSNYPGGIIGSPLARRFVSIIINLPLLAASSLKHAFSCVKYPVGYGSRVTAGMGMEILILYKFAYPYPLYLMKMPRCTSGNILFWELIQGTCETEILHSLLQKYF